MQCFWIKNNDITLKSILLLSAVLFIYARSFAQTSFPYDRSWKKIDSLIWQKGLPKSALEEVNRLYVAAKKEKQEAQWAKALVYQQELQQPDNDNMVKSWKQLENEEDSTPPRVAAMLKSLEAGLFFNFLQQRRYSRSGRTEVVIDSSEDISTWTDGKLNKKIRELYLGSLKDENLLQQTNADAFDVMIRKGNVRYLRPTLYDFLAYRALEYFQFDDPEKPMPEDAFEMDNPAIFLPGRQFMEYDFRDPDSLSNHQTALKLFQNLLRFHAKDTKTDAWIDADISRLIFAKRYAVIAARDSLYLSSLQQITERHPTQPSSAKAWYLQAAYYAGRAAAFNPITDTAHQYEYEKARAICEMVSKQKDSSEGKTNCYILLNNILRKTFRLQTEKVNIPDLPFRALVTYKNIHHIYARIIRIDDATRDDLQYGSYPDSWKKLRHFPALKSFDQALPESRDYQEHSVEIKVDALPAGQYALFTCPDSSFESVLGVQYFFCSSIAFVNHGPDYFVVDRNTGQPLAGVNIQSLHRVFDPTMQKNIYRKGSVYKTDQHGYFRLIRHKNVREDNSRLEFYYGRDYLSFTGENIYSYNSMDNDTNVDAAAYEKKKRKDILFTDRAIYRPGQTVGYKGLMITKDFNTKRYKVVEGIKSKLYLLDANDQRVDSAMVQPDEYGSFQGSFKLPGNLLNGEFRIRDTETDDSYGFSVEEYKRPGFYVVYDRVKGNYSVGDSIRISGSAKGYAGNSVNGSRVIYRVFRESRFPYPWYFRNIPSSAGQEIRHGETSTDADGLFKINFLALADQTIKKESKPVFTYRIETDITDLNGETRSAATSVAAGYESFQIVSPLPQESRTTWDSLQQIPVTTQNASGEFQPQLLTVSLYRLKAPARLIRKRYWGQPDQFIMQKDEYVKNFPNDEYKDEANKASWEKQIKFEKTDSTRASGLFPGWADGKTPASGWYLMEFKSKDKNGDWIIDRRFIELCKSEENKPAYPTYNAIVSEDQTGEPGGTLNIRSGTSVRDVWVIRSRETAEDTLTQYSFYGLNEEIKTTALKITDNDRGGFAMNDVFIKNNRWYSIIHIIHVPWTNKELRVSYETWRNKLLPGSVEKWKIKISGDKKNRVAAEVMTAMYDASLDQFKKQAWEIPDLYPVFSAENAWTGVSDFDDQVSLQKPLPDKWTEHFYERYDELVIYRAENRQYKRDLMAFDVALQSPERIRMSFSMKTSKAEEEKFTSAKIEKDDGIKTLRIDPSAIQIRKNFNETAFFFPDLKTDEAGDVEIYFTMPEALTQWKWMIFAHTKDLAFGYSEKKVITQKELMLQPNMPRFFREGDSMRLPVKISNVSAEAMTGTVNLDWLDAGNSSNQNALFQNKTISQSFHVPAGQSTVLYFSTVIPDHFRQPVVYRIQAKTNTGNHSDGEEGIVPVMGNRMLVTETLPLNMAGRERKSFSWEKLLKSKTSSTLENQSLTLEYTTNPAWYAVQALPYLMEFPYECAEQIFNRFFANALAMQIVNSAPGIRAIFEKWRNVNSSALLSNLQKNEELKTVLLRETPWVLDGENEAQQKKNMAFLFDLVKMSKALNSNLDKLKQMQSAAGGFPWFKGGRDDRYITQYIISGIGHLRKLNAIPDAERNGLDQMSKFAIAFLDRQLKSDYDHRQKKEKEDISATQIQYLYMRSFFPETGLPGSVFPTMNYYRKLAVQNWAKQNMYLRGMIALFLYRTGDRKTARDIISSLKENATSSEELGTYWKSVRPGYYWQESPVETQALLIEAFSEISPDSALTDQMKYWLLEQKHTRQWSNTKSTADACYALLMKGNNWLGAAQSVKINLGGFKVSSSDEEAEAGTGYLKKVIPAERVQPSMGNIEVSIHHEGNVEAAPSWGALYWQYFENADRITSAESPLSVRKALYIIQNTGAGPVLETVNTERILKPGDQLVIRIIIKADRDMEYVHLKDMRAACLEPKNVLSGYHWQGDLGYYETTRDESTSFFFDYLPKGTHVFEYPLYVSTAGDYSNGISTLECMYAPEFAAHTEDMRIRVHGK
ncbi:MAG: alpha-2-macroglobulin family protein [Bacteroidota bacterium]|nr:alpha-2-macroglobulin family protein [Bacteroidota bacterium]